MTPEEVAGLMGEALGDDDVGLDDNFFEIGGNSFMLLRMITQVAELTSVQLRVLDVVRAASPNELAALINARARDDASLDHARRDDTSRASASAGADEPIGR